MLNICTTPEPAPEQAAGEDHLAIIERNIKRLSRQLKTLRARRASLMPERVKRMGPWRKAQVFEINGLDVTVSLRESQVLERLIACPEGEVVPIAEIWALFDGNMQWTRSALYKLNRKLETARAEILCRRRRGYLLVDLTPSRDEASA